VILRPPGTPGRPGLPSLPVLPGGEAVPVTPADRLPVTVGAAGRDPRNLLGWFTPERRQRVGAGMVAAGGVVAVVLALQFVDGGRSDSVRLGNSTATETSTTAPAAAVAGDGGELQVRRAPVADLPVPVEDRPSTTRVVRVVPREQHVVAGTATTRAVQRAVTPMSATPSPTPSPSPSTSSPSPSPSASPTASPTSPTSSASPTVTGDTGTLSPSSVPTVTTSAAPPGGSAGTGTFIDTGTSSLIGTESTPTTPGVP
jgi:hypothetical protein